MSPTFYKNFFIMGKYSDMFGSMGVGLVGSVGRGLIQSGFNALSAGLNYRYSKKLMKYQNDLAIQNWQMQNEYNAPSAQVERLKAAGLAPELMYSNGSSGGVSADLSQPNATAPMASVDTTPLNPLTLAQIRNINADTDLKGEQKDLTGEKTESEKVLRNLNNARIGLTREMKELTTQQYLSEVERSRIYHLEALTKQLYYNALAKEYDIPVYDSDGKQISTKRLNLFETNALGDAASVVSSLMQNVIASSTLGGTIDAILSSSNAICQEVELQYGKEGVQRYLAKQSVEYLKAVLAKYGVDDIANINNYDDLKKKMKDKKVSLAVWKAYREIGECYNYLTHTFEGSTTEQLTLGLKPVVDGAFQALGLYLNKGRGGRSAPRNPYPSNTSSTYPYERQLW